MKPDKEFISIAGGYPFKGLASNDPSTLILPQYSPFLKNIDLRDGLVEKRRGYLELPSVEANDDPDLVALSDTVIGIVEWSDDAATPITHLICITADQQYVYRPVSGKTGWVKLRSTSPWNGDESNYLDWVDVTDVNDKVVIFTNGENSGIEWNGEIPSDGAQDKAVAYVSGTFTWFKTIETFYNRVFVANFESGGNVYDKDFAWTVPGDRTDYTGVGSGSIMIKDLDGGIVRLEKLGDRLIVYSENSIALVSYLGSVNLFSASVLLQNTQLVNGRCIANIGVGHYFMGKEDFFFFDGSRFLKPVGGLISRRMRNYLDHGLLERAFAFHDPIKRRIYWIIPTTEFVNYNCLVMDYKIDDLLNPRWSSYKFETRPSALGLWTNTSGLTWEGLGSLTWNDLGMKWEEMETDRGPMSMIGGTSGPKVHTFSQLYAEDEDIDSEAVFDTPDLVVPPEYIEVNGRWAEIELELRGSEVEVLLSVDKGDSFTALKTLTLTQSWKKYRIPLDKTTETLRVRLKTTEKDFKLRMWRVWVRPGSRR